MTHEDAMAYKSGYAGLLRLAHEGKDSLERSGALGAAFILEHQYKEPYAYFRLKKGLA